MSKLGPNAPPAIEFEFLADPGDRLDDRGVVLRGGFVAMQNDKAWQRDSNKIASGK